MTIRYKTRDLSYAVEYMRIHLRDKYFVSAYKRNGEYIIQISGVEEVKDEAEQTEPQMGDAKPIPLSSRITKTEPTTEDCSTVNLSAEVKGSERSVKGTDPLHDDCFDCDKFFDCDDKGEDYKTDCPWK